MKRSQVIARGVFAGSSLAIVGGLAVANVLGWGGGAIAAIVVGTVGLGVAGLLVRPALGTLAGSAAANRGLTVLLGLVAFGLASFINHRGVRAVIDLTPTREHSLSDETVRRLRALEEPIDVTVIRSADDMPAEHLDLNDKILEMLERYVAASAGKVRLVRFEGADHEARAERFIRSLGLDPREQVLPVVVVQCGDRHRHIEHDAFERRVDPYTTEFHGESLVTNAIIDLVQSETPSVYFTAGHGEGDPSLYAPEGFSRLRAALVRQNVRCRSVQLEQAGAVPEDCAALVVLAPRRHWSAREGAALAAYLRRGGRLLAFLDCAFEVEEEPVTLARVLEPWGIELPPAVAFDPGSPFRGDPSKVWVSAYGAHAAVQWLQDEPSIYLAPRVIRLNVESVQPPAGRDLDGVVLLETSAQSFGETDLARLEASRDYGYDEGVDVAGPVSFGVAVEEVVSTGDSDGNRPATRIAVLGDGSFIANYSLERFRNWEKTHLAIAQNLLNWILTREPRVRIPPRASGYRRLSEIDVSDRTIRLLTWAGTVGLPLLVLALGGLMWWWRRRGR